MRLLRRGRFINHNMRERYMRMNDPQNLTDLLRAMERKNKESQPATLQESLMGVGIMFVIILVIAWLAR